MQYVGIDWGTRRASWCAVDARGALMSGAVWVRDRLADVGWDIRLADARKVKAIAPLACKTVRVDARVLADLARRDLIPEVWVPTVEVRANRERLRRRSHLIRLRTSATNRTFGLLTQWGRRRNLAALREPDAIEELAVPEVWRRSM
jgi:transposase